jgi:DNA-directed RNA polymerase specialized sigma24 family protein
MGSGLDVARCEGLVARAESGDVEAWKELIAELWPVWTRQVRGSRAMGSLARSEDHVRDVLAKLVEKLGQDDGRGLRLYRPWRERHPDKTFADWMHIVVANAIRDHVRTTLGESKATAMDEPSVKRLLNEFAASPALKELGVRPPITAAQTARQMLEFAERRLPPDQYLALTHWIDGASFGEIEAELGEVAPGQGQKLVRAAVATLRRHFAGGAAGA